MLEPPRKRQMQIIKLLAQGLTKRLIGEALFISEHTVRAHTANMSKQYGVHTMAQLVAVAYQQRWLPLPERRRDGEPTRLSHTPARQEPSTRGDGRSQPRAR